MQSGAPAAPNGAPTWPPWVTYPITGQVLLNGCLPPPVVRQPGLEQVIVTLFWQLLLTVTGTPLLCRRQIMVLVLTSAVNVTVSNKTFGLGGHGTPVTTHRSTVTESPAARNGTVNGFEQIPESLPWIFCRSTEPVLWMTTE